MKILFLLASVIALAHSQQFSTRNGLPFQGQRSFMQQSIPFQSSPAQFSSAPPQQQPFQQQPFQQQAFQQQPIQQQQQSFGPQPNQFMPNNNAARFSPQMVIGGAFQSNNQFAAAPVQQQQQQQQQQRQVQFGGAQGQFNGGAVPQPQVKFVAASVQQPTQFGPMPVQAPQGRIGPIPPPPPQQQQPTQFSGQQPAQAQFAAGPAPAPPAQFERVVGGPQPFPSGPMPVAAPQGKIGPVPVPPQQQPTPIAAPPAPPVRPNNMGAVPVPPLNTPTPVAAPQGKIGSAPPPPPPPPPPADSWTVQQADFSAPAPSPVQQSISPRPPVNRVTAVANVPDIPRFCSFRNSIECDPNFPYRTLNGSCNNLNNLWWGKAETPYKRYIEADYGDKINEPRLSVDGGELPNPYDISCTLHREAHEIEPFVTHILMQWGQIVSHDVSSLSLTTDDERNISTCDSCTRTQKCLPMLITQNVTCACVNQMRHPCLEFVRSSAAFGDLACRNVLREQLNLQTSYLDASIVYGILESDIAPLMEARGRFRLQSGRGILLPDMTEDPSDCMDFTNDRRCFLAGDNRVNQNPGLQLLQTVLVREHNRVAAILASINPKWNDRTVFEEARRVVIAEVQHITFSEYLPILLGESVWKQTNLVPLQGSEQANVYDPSVDPRTANEFAAAAGRFGHSMIRSIYSRADNNYNTIGTFMLRNQFFRSHMFYDDSTNGGLESVARGFLKDPSMKVDQWFTEDVSRHLFETADDFGRPFHFDLVSLNIQRGREHGLPSYVRFRDLCRLSPVRSWDDMRKVIPSEVVDIFRSLYRFVEDVDFYSAGLSEIKVNGGLLGPTFTCIVAKQFHDIKFGDRFWYETNQAPGAFTPGQLGEIRKLTLAKMLCRNLKNTPKIQPNAMLSSKLKENKLVNCADLPDANWNLWRV